MKLAVCCCLALAFLALVSPAPRAADSPAASFTENFDDSALAARGWYDVGKVSISADNPHSGAGCIEYGWAEKGAAQTVSSPARRLFAPTESVYISFYIRLAPGWGWSGRDYHPHLVNFMTTENDPYRGPASSHLTLYVEPVGGRLRLAAQDMQNANAPHGLTQGPLRGGYNGRLYDSTNVLFNDSSWHHVEAFFQLNTVDAGKGTHNADGIVRGWFDGALVVDSTDAVFRSADFPHMKFNQLLLAPYFGPGLVPHAQSLFIDDLAVAPSAPR
jgi:hypothetical protein